MQDACADWQGAVWPKKSMRHGRMRGLMETRLGNIGRRDGLSWTRGQRGDVRRSRVKERGCRVQGCEASPSRLREGPTRHGKKDFQARQIGCTRETATINYSLWSTSQDACRFWTSNHIVAGQVTWGDIRDYMELATCKCYQLWCVKPSHRRVTRAVASQNWAVQPTKPFSIQSASVKHRPELIAGDACV